MKSVPADQFDLLVKQNSDMKALIAQHKAQGEENRRLMGSSPTAFYRDRADREEKIEIAQHVRRYIRAAAFNNEAEYVALTTERPEWYKGHANFNEGTNAQGLFAVPDVWLDQIFAVVETYGFVRRLFKVTTLTTKNTLLTKLNAFTTATFTSEGGAATLQDAANMLERTTITAKLLKGALLWTEELEEDAMASLLPALTEQLGIDIARVEDVVGIAGSTTGAGPSAVNDAFNGLIFQTFTNTATMSAGRTAFSQASWVDLENLANTAVTSINGKAVYLAPRATYLGLKTEVDQNDRPIWGNERPIDGAGHVGLEALRANTRWTPNGTAMVVVPDSLWVASGAGKVAAVYGDFDFAMMGVRKGLTTKTFNEYYGTTALSGQNKVLELSERIAFGFPDMGAFACLKTAAS